MNIKNNSIDDARNSDLHNQIREQMLKGEEPVECKLCWDEESIGFKSKRLHMLQEYPIDKIIDITPLPLTYIDIRFGNLCNLKCRSCGPSDSSLWYDDHVELSGNKEFNFYSGTNYQLEKINNVWTLKNDDFHWYEDENFWDMIRTVIPNVDRLYLTGGEPWVNKSQWRLLELCVSLNQAKNIILEYNSNLTKIPNNALELWSEFKKVNIGCSIDAIGDLANYVRYPSEWNEIENNIKLLGTSHIRNIVAKFSPTVSVFNVLGVLDVADWLKSNRLPNIRPLPSYHILNGPDYQNLTVLPIETKNWIIEQYELWFKNNENQRAHYMPILKFMTSADNSHLLPKLKHQTEILDKSRNQNVSDYLPWLGKILENID
jgi:sulfatase maturation enzyme AslB (radical SAM superfamily)